MIENIREAGIMAEGTFIAGMGLILVFAVLVLFFLSIKILGKFGEKKNSGKDAAD